MSATVLRQSLDASGKASKEQGRRHAFHNTATIVPLDGFLDFVLGAAVSSGEVFQTMSEISSERCVFGLELNEMIVAVDTRARELGK